MSWNDIEELKDTLTVALNVFDWPAVNEKCAEIIHRIRTEGTIIPEPEAKGLMKALRRKRRLAQMAELGEAMLQSGLRTPLVRCLYAQSLIDQGLLTAGETVLQRIINDSATDLEAESEARGSTGRIYKQIYVNNADPASPANRANLERALQEYLYVYRLNPKIYLWHGINVVALAERARRDKFPAAGLPETKALAKKIISALPGPKSGTGSRLAAYDLATKMEAFIALKDYKRAIKIAAKYVEQDDADAFEINSTIRQLTEVWQLNDGDVPGRHLLPILRAGHLKRAGASSNPDPVTVRAESRHLQEAMADLEAILGDDRMVPLVWYKKGLDQCNSVARVEHPNGRPQGTAWLVNASDFFPAKTGVLLLTNNHVVSDEPTPFRNPYAIHTTDARINFQALGLDEPFEVEEKVVWKSPIPELDATFLALRGRPPAPPLKLYPQDLLMRKPPQRLYIIGHPEGRNLELSLHDNFLLGFNERLVHYRTPTERGNSGSPVFEDEDWRVIALHHAGGEARPRLDNPTETYPANEGIAIKAIQTRTRAA